MTQQLRLIPKYMVMGFHRGGGRSLHYGVSLEEAIDVANWWAYGDRPLKSPPYRATVYMEPPFTPEWQAEYDRLRPTAISGEADHSLWRGEIPLYQTFERAE